ncbi:NAD(P)/FAD-dependent oxidoreductase [Microvirga pudoricolor]|uniref:NAD(P)/FAD-dependent oxidoreductase n=1 Tax=Microvirga pudoricolor TaxID=2778729 RepID=UPI00194DCC16|nr:FAD-binding oxidoreductase [Microvirga pudoricolor]MBM6595130.1 FAD-binding oxidoreductase [Microvirga pudoricolor]
MNADVVIVGSGISGAASAYELAKAGLKVVLVDRFGPAAMASGWTLAGVRQSGRHPAELPLAKAAVEIWATLAEDLDGETGYRRGGNLRLARTPEEVPVIETLVKEQRAAGLDLTILPTTADVRAVAPALSETVLLASHCPSDGSADPATTVQSFVRAAERLGAVTRFGERAQRILVENGRVAGVETDKGRISSARVVVAAGIFGNELLKPLGYEVPLQVPMVTVLRSAPVDPVLEQVIGVANADCAGRQENNGRFRVTSGLQDWHGGLRERQSENGLRPSVLPTGASMAEVVRLFGEVVPAFAEAQIEDYWAGLIDLTPDALPVIDGTLDPEGLIVAMGFSGHGFCLGPITGRIISDLAQDRQTDLPIQPFGIRRFAGLRNSQEPATLHG